MFQRILSAGVVFVCMVLAGGRALAVAKAGVAPPRLVITHLTGNIYVYTTWRMLGKAPYPSNSAYLVTNKGVVLLDCPWDTTQYQPLLDSIAARHHQPVVLCISTHFHADRTCALNFLKAKGVATYSSALTRELCKEHHLPEAEHVFVHDTSFVVGGYTIRTYYPGPGHTRDNIVVWLARDRVLYGGCIVKSTEAPDLGNLEDASLADYPASIRRLIDRYPNAAFVIPGHLGWTDVHSLQHTMDMLRERK
ncbi:MAG TPA: subclass B1 metallo-beta-lactamase [Puia sp.]|nr:subclass B1 metallo-beta-lactamase [Puia sp.]